MSDLGEQLSLQHTWDRVDRARLELVWAALDRVLADPEPLLQVRDLVGDDGRVRSVEALGLVQVHVHYGSGRVVAFWREQDLRLRPLSPPLVVHGLFQYTWWMRFAFQRWAPSTDGRFWTV